MSGRKGTLERPWLGVLARGCFRAQHTAGGKELRMSVSPKVAIIGGGLAGLGAAYELRKRGLNFVQHCGPGQGHLFKVLPRGVRT